MTKRENMLNTLKRKGYNEVPSDMGLTPPVMERFKEMTGHEDTDSYYNLSHRNAARHVDPLYEGDGKYLFSGKNMPHKYDVDAFGVGISYGSDAAYHMCHFHSPLEGEVSLSDLENYPLPAQSPGEEQRLTREAEEIKARGFAAVGAMEQTIWERSWLIRGMNSLMMDMMMDAPEAHVILNRITELSENVAGLYAKCGFDIIRLGDDVGMQNTLMMSPELWRKWLKPRLKQIIETIKATKSDCLVFYHSCGFIEPLIPELIEIGIDILNPIQPECMDVKKIFRDFGQDVSFWGGIGTQTTFPFGTPEEVKKAVRHLVDLSGSRGGLVLGPTHVIEPEVPWENLEAFREVIGEINKTG